MSQIAPAGALVQWHAWSTEAFARARLEERPVLLALTTAWSRGGREMDRTTYADPALAAEINSRCIPVRVDADERPDVAERYELGGIPTTVFLSARGAVLGGGTFVTPERLRLALRRVAATPLADLPAETIPSEPGVSRSEAVDGSLEEAILGSFDDAHGGFGGAPKFPHAAAVRLAMLLAEERKDARLLERAVRTMDAIGWRGLADAASGGFYRCCAAADWSDPQPDLLLDVNVALLEMFLDAAEATPVARYRSLAAGIVRFIETSLTRQDGAWRVAAGVEASRVFTDINAACASALLRASRVLEQPALGERAIAGLEHVLLASYKPGEGVAHYAGGVRGLLTDHVAMMSATLDAWEETGNIVYRMMAEELAHYALRTMWSADAGAFLDRAPCTFADEPPASKTVVTPFVLNCRAAAALARLSLATADPTFAARARSALEAVAPLAREQGPEAAHLLLARRAVPR